MSSRDSLPPSVPPISARDEPRFGSGARKSALAAAFHGQGADYDRLRPGYPGPVLDAILAQLPGERTDGGATSSPDGGDVDVTSSDAAASSDAAVASSDVAATSPAVAPTSPAAADGPLARHRAIDLGAGTGKLSWALVSRGLDVTAVDTSPAMLETALHRGPSDATTPGPSGHAGSVPSAAVGPAPSAVPAPVLSRAGALTTQLAPAESTGLPVASAELVTVAQAWHWFDARAASAEVARLLAPGGVLALVWNMLDVTIPWVHRLSRIMHAGDVHREDFLPTVGPGLTLLERGVHEWEDPMPTGDVIDLARTRSYVLTATEERRAKVLANLDWYLHEHLGHDRGAVIGVPYRTDWFVYRPA